MADKDAEIDRQIEAALESRGMAGAAAGDDQFGKLVDLLISDEQFRIDVHNAVEHGISSGDWNQLIDVWQAKGFAATREQIRVFVGARSCFGRMRDLAAAFGHSNIGTFN